jgi:hypothetical protein
MKRHFPLLTAAVALSACTATTTKEAPVAETPAPAAPSTCPVLGSRNWQAKLTKPANTPASLTVTGEVDLPTPGYTITLRQGLTDRAMPPSQQILTEFVPPQGMVTQVVTTEQVSFTLPGALPQYRSVLIRCSDTALATITDIQGQP